MATTTWQAGWLEVSGAIGAIVALVAACWLSLQHRGRDRRDRERVNQPKRQARELQDTLLQNFQGVLLKFHAAASLLPQRAAEARTLLDDALSQADQVIAEARDAVQAQASTNGFADGLTEDLLRLAAELGAD